jgi:hypothetical protein
MREQSVNQTSARRFVTIEFPNIAVDHLDRQARYRCCSRAAYIRALIVDDMERVALRQAQQEVA